MRRRIEVLPARRRPFPDELVTSWLTRLARANALKVQEILTLANEGRRHNLLNHDLDASLPTHVVTGMARLCAIPADEIIGLTLDAKADRLISFEISKTGTRRWTLPVTRRNRKPTSNWIQLCIECLRQDDIPYLRQHWRYAFMTICPTHGCLLIDACPCCGMVFDFAASDADLERTRGILPITVCGHCYRDVRTSDYVAQIADKRTHRYQRALLKATRRGWTRIRSHGWVYSQQVLDVLHRLLRLVRTSEGLQRLLKDCNGESSSADAGCRMPSGRFETWSLNDRHRAMQWVSTLLRRWPETFVTRCLRLHVYSYALLGHRGVAPYWFVSVVRTRLYRPWYAPSKEEVTEVRRVITTAGQPDTHYNRRRWLGRYHESKPYMRRIVEGSRPVQMELFEGAFLLGQQHLLFDLRQEFVNLLRSAVERGVAQLCKALLGKRSLKLDRLCLPGGSNS